MNTSKIVDKFSTIADELASINNRLRRANVALFGAYRISDIPIEPPPSDSKNSAPTANVEFNFQDALDYQFNRLVYYTKYADEMLQGIEVFTGTNKNPTQVQAGTSYPNADRSALGAGRSIPTTHDEMDKLFRSMKGE